MVPRRGHCGYSASSHVDLNAIHGQDSFSRSWMIIAIFTRVLMGAFDSVGVFCFDMAGPTLEALLHIPIRTHHCVHGQEHDCDSCQLFELSAQNCGPGITTLGYKSTDNTQFPAHTLFTLHKMQVLHWIFGTCSIRVSTYTAIYRNTSTLRNTTHISLWYCPRCAFTGPCRTVVIKWHVCTGNTLYNG